MSSIDSTLCFQVFSLPLYSNVEGEAGRRVKGGWGEGGGEETDSSEFVWWGVNPRNPYLVFQPKHVIFSVMHSRFCILELSRLFAPSSLPFSVKSFRAGATLKLPGIVRTRAQGGLGGGGNAI